MGHRFLSHLPNDYQEGKNTSAVNDDYNGGGCGWQLGEIPEAPQVNGRLSGECFPG